ncbi:MAG: hypothetical protein Q4D90_10980 [bacterium]|nr:hypothetical protein [bacterium]
MELLHLLQEPAREYSPIPFWFLNGDLTEEELCRQLKDFVAHGVYGVVLHPRIGLADRISYLGKEFFHYIRTAVKAASELGMTVVLYDEGMYPSGSASGQVVLGHPKLASEGLALVETVLEGDEVLAKTEQGSLVARKSKGTLRGLHWGEDDGEENAPFSADILNPEAVQRFLELTHEAYYREVGEYFGNTILGFFTDEPSILGRNVRDMFPWTRGFAEVFKQAGGQLEDLAALFQGKSNAGVKLYQRLLLEREEKVYYGSLSEWCEKHGIALMGHPHQSDDIEVEKYFHIPGQDLVLRWIAPETGGLSGIDSTMAKCSADAARLMQRRRNANECFGACNKNGNPWQLSGGDIKWYLDWLAVRGVNLFIPHAFYYSIEGKCKEDRPPDVGPNNIWWPYYKQWANYMSRLACLMTDVQLRASVAVLCKNRDLKAEQVRPLFENQVGFQYLPESVWKECESRENGLVFRGETYRWVLGETEAFPELPLFEIENEPSCTRLMDAPLHYESLSGAIGIPELSAAYRQRDFQSKEARDLICEPPCPSLRVARFLKAGKECWFLVNEGDTALCTSLKLPTQQRLGRYDLWEGRAERQESEEGSFSLQLGMRESLLLFACTEEEYEALPPQKESYQLSTPSFVLKEEKPELVQKRYEAVLVLEAEDLAHEKLQLSVEAEEMAELYINGSFAGVGFWSPQNFDVTGLLREGENQLTLVVTGSLANRYGREKVDYGMKV